jgi:hypothetical protein
MAVFQTMFESADHPTGADFTSAMASSLLPLKWVQFSLEGWQPTIPSKRPRQSTGTEAITGLFIVQVILKVQWKDRKKKA